MTDTAKLFQHGRSQAVRLPKAYRFAGTEVRVSKVGDKVILEPITQTPFDPDALWTMLDAMGAQTADFPVPDDELVTPDQRISFDP